MSTLLEIYDKSNGFQPSFLYLLVLVSVVSGVLIITTKNPILSVLFLILLFSNIACYLVLIGEIFLGLSYLLVYVGAVSILFLFILMLINIRVSELIADTSNGIPLGILYLIAIYVPISNILPYTTINKSVNSDILPDITINKTIYYVTSFNWDGTISDISDITSIGNVMYTSHSMWLMVTSLILLLSMVGSIIITIKQKD